MSATDYWWLKNNLWACHLGDLALGPNWATCWHRIDTTPSSRTGMPTWSEAASAADARSCIITCFWTF